MKKKRFSVFSQIFLATLIPSLTVAALLALAAHSAVRQAFRTYLVACGMGGSVLQPSEAESLFIANLNVIFYLGAVLGIAVAVVASYLVATRISRPIKSLEAATHRITNGETPLEIEPSNVKEIEQLGTSMLAMAEKLEESEQLKKRMVSDVAHELRNPIAALQAQLEGVQDGIIPVNEKTVASLLEDTITLSALVQDLRALSIAEESLNTLHKTDVNLTELTQKEVDRTKLFLAEDVSLELVVPNENVVVEGDPKQLETVMRNLLTNASRYTEQGSIMVKLEVVPTSAEPPAIVKVSVIDTGLGIPEADLQHIFERFYRADNSRSVKTGGTGLGLAIVKRVIEAHGGEVFAEESSTGGLCIGFELPL